MLLLSISHHVELFKGKTPNFADPAVRLPDGPTAIFERGTLKTPMETPV
jgi:hypothetical protein